MTNLEIITESAIAAGIYTEDQALSFLEAAGCLPLHTYKEWQRMGYQVRKGEKSKLTCYIWRKKSKKKEEDAGEETVTVTENSRSFYKTKAFFFTHDQVEKIEKTA